MDHRTDATSVQNASGTPLKRRRITRACDRCHRSGIKCSPGDDPNTCGPCASYGTACTYVRPTKRRGPPPKTRDSLDGKTSHASPAERESSDGGDRGASIPGPVGYDQWVYHEIAPPEIIEELADAYHAIIYPIQNYFHWPSFFRDVRDRRYQHDRPFFACVMALCALTSARLRDGACLPNLPQSDPRHDESSPLHRYVAARPTNVVPLQDRSPTSEDFYMASCDAIPRDPTRATDFNYKRAKTHLALLCIQYGDVRQLFVHLHDYLASSALDGFHLESRWPPNLTEIEVQERRRMYWATYQLDVYVAVTWGVTIRQRESETTVLYPAEVYDDDDIREDGIYTSLPTDPSKSLSSHIRGWNFTTDLYRILEHAVAAYRTRRRGPEPDPRGAVSALYREKPARSSGEVLAVVHDLYSNLPQEFRTVEPVSGDVYKDRFGFQAVNIIITMQTLKMVLAGSEESSVSQKCAIAGELLDALANVPTAYIQAISAPTLHHLAGVGHLLGSVIHSPLSQWTYLQVRNILLSLADLLQGLASALSSQTIDIAQRLRSHVSRIDAYMTDAAKARREIGITHGVSSQTQLEGQYRPTLEPRTSDTRTQSADFRMGAASSTALDDLASSSLRGKESLRRTRSGSPPQVAATIDAHRTLAIASTHESPTNQASQLRQLVMQSQAGQGASTATAAPAAHWPVDPELSDSRSTSGPKTSFNGSPGMAVGTQGGNIAPPLSSPAQFTLPQDLFFDWPFDLGQGEAFDLLGDLGGFWTNNFEAASTTTTTAANTYDPAAAPAAASFAATVPAPNTTDTTAAPVSVSGGGALR